jgi:hypothetical protein
MVGLYMNNDLERIWKEANVVYYPGVRLEEVRNTTRNLNQDNLTEHFPNTGPEIHTYAKPLRPVCSDFNMSDWSTLRHVLMILSRAIITIDGVWMVNRFIDHPQIVATNNYNTIAISTLYSLLDHTLEMLSVLLEVSW